MSKRGKRNKSRAATTGEAIDKAAEPTIKLGGRVFALKTPTATGMSGAVASNAMDEWDKRYGADLIPPYLPLDGLAGMLTNCDVMSQCIEAMRVNTHGQGWHLEYVPSEDGPDKKEDDVDKAEKQRLEMLFRYPNAQQTWVEIKEDILEDKCLMGAGYLEIVRNLADEIAEFYRLPSKTMFISKRDKQPTDHIEWIRVGDQWMPKARRTFFRRFCQAIGAEKVWFKELGDPRSLNKKTGKFAGEDETGRPLRWPAEDEASEVLMFSYRSPNSVYGQPPWLSELLKIMGTAEANQVNYAYFSGKTIPPWIITISGGTLGDKAVQDLQEYLDQEFRGTENFHKILVLEAEPFMAGIVGDEKPAPIRIEVKPLTQFMEKDALFQEYIKNNAKAVRESYRIPPLLIGAAEEYSHAAVTMALIVAEQQVFGPQRTAHDEIINRKIIAAMGISNYKMVSHGVPTVDDTTIIDAMSQLPDAVPYAAAVKFISNLMGVDPPEIPPELQDQTIGQIHSGRDAMKLQTALAARARQQDVAPSQSDQPPEGEPNSPDNPGDAEADTQLIKGLRIARDAMLMKYQRNPSLPKEPPQV